MTQEMDLVLLEPGVTYFLLCFLKHLITKKCEESVHINTT